jgi:hypothetical protein
MPFHFIKEKHSIKRVIPPKKFKIFTIFLYILFGRGGGAVCNSTVIIIKDLQVFSLFYPFGHFV